MSQASLVVNLFVLKNWAKIPPREGIRLAKWATAANYSFRTNEQGELVLENPNNGHNVTVEREVQDGKVKFYFRIIRRGKPQKKCFNYELEAFQLLDIFPNQRVFGESEEMNIKIRELEEG